MADLLTLPDLHDSIDAKVTTNAPLKENTGARVNELLNDMADTLWNHGTGAEWGEITGTLSDQTDLQSALNLKADADNPYLTGITHTPTETTSDSSNKIASTAFVHNVVDAAALPTPVGEVLFVNATSGDDGTGARGRLDLQYETIDAAYADLVDGDTIEVLGDGTYSINSSIVNGFTLYAPNATVTGTLLTSASSLTINVECKIFDGMIDDGGDGGNTISVRNTQGPSEVYLAPDDVLNAINSKIGFDAFNLADSVEVNAYNSTIFNLVGASNSTLNAHNSTLQVTSGFDTGSITANGCEFLGGGLPLAILGIGSQGNSGVIKLLSASFSSTTTDADPGAGLFRLNNGTFGSVTQLFISTTDGNGNDITAYLDAHSAGELVARTLDGSKTIIFTVASITSATGYRKFTVTPALGALPLADEYYTFDFRTTAKVVYLSTTLAAPTSSLNVPIFIARSGLTIIDVRCQTDSGTVNCAFKINTTDITSLSAVAVSSTPATSTATAANVMVAGDVLRVLHSSASTPVNAIYTFTALLP